MTDKIGEVLSYIFFIYCFIMIMIGSGTFWKMLFVHNPLTILQMLILGAIGFGIGLLFSWLIYNG